MRIELDQIAVSERFPRRYALWMLFAAVAGAAVLLAWANHQAWGRSDFGASVLRTVAEPPDKVFDDVVTWIESQGFVNLPYGLPDHVPRGYFFEASTELLSAVYVGSYDDSVPFYVRITVAQNGMGLSELYLEVSDNSRHRRWHLKPQAAAARRLLDEALKQAA